MITYTYKAKRANAETVTGQISAQSQDEAVELINQLGLLPITVDPLAGKDEPVHLSKHRKIPSKETYIFTRQLANLVKSGVTILRAINIMAEQTDNRVLKKVLSNIASQIQNGKSMSDSFAEYPNIFSSLYVTMVRAGEESGNLHAMLESIALYQHAQEEIRSKVRSAVAYPIFMLFVGVGTIYFMFSFVLPRMASLFDTMGDQLPLPTQILLKISQIISQWGLWSVFIFVVVIFLLTQWAKSKPGKKTLSYLVLNIPLFGDMLLRRELARFCRTLVLLNQGGVSLVNALQIAIPLLENDVVKTDFVKCRENLITGGSFGETLKKSKKIPSMMGYLVAVGEETGSLDDVLLELAQTYENETNEQIKIMTTYLEPLMILAIGLVIGFIVIAMLLPIFQLDVMSGS